MTVDELGTTHGAIVCNRDGVSDGANRAGGGGVQTLQNTLTAEHKAHIKVIGLRASHLQGVRPNRSSTSNSTGDR